MMRDIKLLKNTWIYSTGLLSTDEFFCWRRVANCFTHRLWEQSWEDGAQKWSIEPEQAYDPSKIHRIEFEGMHDTCTLLEERG